VCLAALGFSPARLLLSHLLLCTDSAVPRIKKKSLNPLLQLLQGCIQKLAGFPGAEEFQVELASMENRRSIVAIRSQVVQQPAVSPTKEGTGKPSFLFLFLQEIC
jgi:hypothetical protein